MVALLSMKNFMKEALLEAEYAERAGEVPVGAVIALEGEIIGRGRNRILEKKDPTAHAEMEAIQNAAKAIGRERLEGAIMYVTLEPCIMCAGALVLARVKKLVIGAEDPKSGACGSVFNTVNGDRLNHSIEVEFSSAIPECGGLLKEFFRRRRKENKITKSKKFSEEV